jgi:hypothetical protein
MTFARRVFLTTGIYGILILVPQFFVPTTNPQPELYYGFLGAVLAWNLTYLLIARDPARYRPLMLLGSLGKTNFAIAATVLWILGRSPAFLLAFAAIDAVIVAFYLESWRRTAPAPASAPCPDRVARETGVLVLDFGRSLERARN